MGDNSNLKDEIERRREEIRRLLHTGSARVQQQWRDLEEDWADFASKAQLKQTSESVEDAARRLGGELAKGYDRIRTALASDEQPAQLTASQRERVEKLARELWEKRGRPEGDPEADWVEAEKQVREQDRAARQTTG